jgi:Spy/CpxP family protein refolding chaperone
MLRPRCMTTPFEHSTMPTPRLVPPLAALIIAAAACAPTPPAASPHATIADREIKALSADEIAGFRAGAGMGFALAAELNGYPGPMHVLELAGELELSAEQRAAVQASRSRMQEEASALGANLVERERQLDRLFAGGNATEPEVRRLTGEIAELRGRIRHAHLRAHLETTEILTRHQVHRYMELRGYAAEGHHDHAAAPPASPLGACPPRLPASDDLGHGRGCDQRDRYGDIERWRPMLLPLQEGEREERCGRGDARRANHPGREVAAPPVPQIGADRSSDESGDHGHQLGTPRYRFHRGSSPVEGAGVHVRQRRQIGRPQRTGGPNNGGDRVTRVPRWQGPIDHVIGQYGRLPGDERVRMSRSERRLTLDREREE